MSITTQVKTMQGVPENVNAVQQGSGAPVILSHGLAASLHDWDDLLPALSAAGYAVHAPDLLGHGASYKPSAPRDFSFGAVFDHFSAWTDSLQITEPMILVGHSLGGGIVLQYALRFPERVRALVLVNPFYDIGQLSAAMRFIYRNKLLNTDLLKLAPYRLFRILVDLTSTNYYKGHNEPHVLPEQVRHQTALDFSRASSGIYNIPYSLPNLTADLGRIVQPVLLIWGRRDQTLAPDSFPRLEKMLPNIVSAHAMPVCGHVPHQCHPEQFNPLVLEFIRGLQGPPRA